jgi:cell wall-associated NlpC family hydrolase
MKIKRTVIAVLALITAMTLSGCIPAVADEDELVEDSDVEYEDQSGVPPEQEEIEEVVSAPAVQTTLYIKVTADSVNIREGAGVGYTSLGTAEKNTLYAYLGEVDGWCKSYYKNSVVYISKKYCTIVQMESSSLSYIEDIIVVGTRCLGVKYVYGATRYHDGSGNLIKSFTSAAFDCSSLMQYVFKLGADINLNVTTRTQITQGKTITKDKLQRGDLLFFTNDSRKDNSGIERVGHVALYLGDNLILHTASDYAKIEEISAKRWSYFIRAQRIIT